MPLLLALAVSTIVACLMVAALVLVGYLVGGLLRSIADVREYVRLRDRVFAIGQVILFVVAILAVAAFDLILAFGQMSIWAAVQL